MLPHSARPPERAGPASRLSGVVPVKCLGSGGEVMGLGVMVPHRLDLIIALAERQEEFAVHEVTHVHGPQGQVIFYVVRGQFDALSNRCSARMKPASSICSVSAGPRGSSARAAAVERRGRASAACSFAARVAARARRSCLCFS